MRTALAALLITFVAVQALPADAQQSVHQRLSNLAVQMVYTMAQRHPMTATALGIKGYDDALESPTRGERDEDVRLLHGWQRQLRAIAPPGAALSLVDRDDAKLLQAQLAQQLNELVVYRSDEKDYSAGAQSIVGAIFTQFQHVPAAGQGGATNADVAKAWGDIVTRLSKSPAYIVAEQRLVTQPGHLQGIVGNQQLAGVPDFFNGPLTNAAKAQLSTSDFARFLKARDAALQTIAQTQRYISAHVASWTENYAMGRRAYDAMLHDEQLLPYNAQDVEAFAATELAHGWAEEAWLGALARERGTSFGPQTGGGLAPGGPALIDYYRAR